MNNQGNNKASQSNSLIAYLYDIPRDDGYSSKELTQIMTTLGYRCEVQITPPKTQRTFVTARVKFDSQAQLHLALLQHKSFKLRDHKYCRLLPYSEELALKGKCNNQSTMIV